MAEAKSNGLIPSQAVDDYERLQRALADVGGCVPCATSDPELWSSNDVRARAVAARLCKGCPIIAECGAYAEAADERWHVWAGVDRTPPAAERRVGAHKTQDPDRNTGGPKKSRQRIAGRRDERKAS